MAFYRIYRVDADGHVKGPPEEVHCTTDQAAVDAARQYVDGCAVEVWQGARVVWRFEAEAGATPGTADVATGHR